MVHVQRTITVSRSVADVLAYLSDFGTTEQWDPGTISCTRNDSGPIRVGSSWHNVSEFRGKRTELTYELTRLEADRLTFVGRNKTATSVDDITVRTDGAHTAITYDATITFNGLAKLADPFLRKEFEKIGDELVPKMTAAVHALPDSAQR